MKMRTRTVILTGALLLVLTGGARAQQDAAAQTATAAPKTDTSTFAPKFGQIDFGYRGNDTTGDAARFQRYRDLRDGAYVDQFKVKKDSDTWLFNATANNVGYRDQRYTASFEDFGRVLVNFDWNQTPLWISDTTATMYKDNGNGYLAIDDGIQQSIQTATAAGNAARDAALKTALSTAAPYDLRSRRNTGLVNFRYSANQITDVKFDLKTSQRSGYNLMSFGFGTSPGLIPALELNVPMDDRTTDVKGSVELANERGLLALGWNGSWFENNRPTVQFDNPLRVVDISGGPSSGLTPLWPTNHQFNYTVTGLYKLPAHSRASAFISFGQIDQNSNLVAPTVNSALFATMPKLERPTAEAKADTVAMVYNLSSRPNNYVSFDARYRYYDYNTKTEHFETTPLIGDWSVGTGLMENEPGSIKRATLDLDGSISAHKYLTLNFGFTREDADRTFRIYEKTDENVFRVSLDSVGSQYVTFRTKYEHSVREGSHFEEHLLEEVGEQPETRHYDVANRKRDRVTAIVTVIPAPYFQLNGSVGTGKDTFDETGFGLLENETNNWSLGASVVPNEKVNIGAEYGWEKITSQQYSRTANPPSATDVTFYDPTRDWWLDQGDKVKTFVASADFLKCIRKTDVRLSYTLSDGISDYVYGMKPEQKVFTTIPLTQLAPLKNWLTDTRIDVNYYVRPNLALGGIYMYEEYKVEDFSLTPTVLNSLAPVNPTNNTIANTIYSGYVYRPYKANTFWLRMTYLW
jgi:MtrB/PioB family decaheme-associated outer membrane protein